MANFDEIKGFGVTLKRLFRKDLTVEYPDERRPLEERFRGLPVAAHRPGDAGGDLRRLLDVRAHLPDAVHLDGVHTRG